MILIHAWFNKSLTMLFVWTLSLNLSFSSYLLCVPNYYVYNTKFKCAAKRDSHLRMQMIEIGILVETKRHRQSSISHRNWK